MNKYNLILQDASDEAKRIELNFENHDDIMHIVEFMKQKFPSEDEAAQFAIGLKLFSGVMMKHRDNPLFTDFEPAFREFMMKLKGKK